MSAKQIVLVTATKKEMRHALPKADLSDLRSGEPFFLPLDSGLILLVTGIALVNAAFVLGKFLGQGAKIQGVINLGLAGSFDLQLLGLKQPVVILKEICPEFGLRCKNGLDPYALKYGQGKLGSRVVWDRLDLNPGFYAGQMGLALPADWPRETSLTVFGATGDPNLARALQCRYQALVENMEGFALAWACLQMGVPFLELRCISNLVGSRQKIDWDMQGALQGLAGILCSVLPGRALK